MAQEDVLPVESRLRGRKRRFAKKLGIVLLSLLVLAVVWAWNQRVTFADDLIADFFRDNGIRATWTVDSIAPNRQVISDLVVGDPALPDLTVDQVVVSTRLRWGLPDVTEIRLVRPRIYGSYRGGTLSFGELDPLVFPEDTGEPFALPDVWLRIEDGRGLMLTDYGRIGVKIAGGGNLQDGFEAELAAVAEELDFDSCGVARPTLYGRLSIDAEQPRFAGPVRFRSLTCPDSDVRLAGGTMEIDLEADREFAAFEGDYAVDFGRSAVASAGAGSLAGEGRFTWREGRLNALYDLAASDVATPAASAASLALQGRLRAVDGFARIELEGDARGEDLRMGADLDGAIGKAAGAVEGTLLAPLLDRLGLNLARALRGSSFAASFDARRIGDLTSVAVPQARLRGGDGATVLALSRAALTFGGGGGPRFAGDFATGGQGLPQIAGRMERQGRGALQMRLAMREYTAGQARLAIPGMTLRQGGDGRISFDGRILASGPLPGGFAQGLALPVDGTWADGALALWTGCREVRFDRLAYANLTLGRQSLTLCPPAGRPILAYGPGGLRLAAGASSLDLTGRLAETPVRVRSGAVGFAWPGALSARNLDVTLGPAANAQRFLITDLRADLSGSSIGGQFAGADVFLASVPLDVLRASGNWRYADDRLTLDAASFTLEDREAEDRFEPLIAEGASLSLFANRVLADAVLRHPGSGQTVSDVHIEHSLASGSGFADLDVPGVTFADGGFQPTDLTRLALGVVANVAGTVTGEGRIDWGAQGVTSTGAFSSESLDLAAAFGPVRGASGTVIFTDLLGLTTAPDQRIRVASVNPGIEIFDGEVGFQLIEGRRIAVTGGTWPFLGGTLTMRPVDINIGVQESRSYILDIRGLEATQFVERMELSNLTASGTFDGTIPIVFDADGNGELVGGTLLSRPPGGHLSYVGELSYEDMGFIANYAFRTLRDLDYQQMAITMNGPLTGELVTQVRLTGISQGDGAERNIVSRIIADLPIELRVNIRAPFYKLISSVRALYDPASVRDPRSLGLVTDDGTRLREAVDQTAVDAIDAEAARRAQCELQGDTVCAPGDDTTTIQDEESEPRP